MKLIEKVAIVTGASRGIGAAIAKRFAQEGAYVVINYCNSANKANDVVNEIVEKGGKAISIQADMRTPQGAKQLVKKAIENFGHLDIFVNNAGGAILQPLALITPRDIKMQFDLNVFGLIYGTQVAAEVIADNGRIINITSIAAKGGANMSVYSATKAAGNALTKCYAAELGPRGITVNAIAPAAMETDLYFEVGLDKFEEQSLAATPLGRTGSVEDVAASATFLASEDAAWITGEIIQVSGGKAM